LSTRTSISGIVATAEGARLQATLKDGTQLMLGENATFVVDEFI
jgi:ferric-dicitrate binding protein FerR (iron transport regulator)